MAVVGVGSIGQLAAASAMARGAPDVALEVRHPHQHAIRERLGFGEPTGLYDVVIEAAGSASAIQRCVPLARPGATIVVLGVVPGPLDVPFTDVLTKEITIVSAMGYCGHPGSRMLQAAEIITPVYGDGEVELVNNCDHLDCDQDAPCLLAP